MLLLRAHLFPINGGSCVTETIAEENQNIKSNTDKLVLLTTDSIPTYDTAIVNDSYNNTAN